MSGHRSSAPPQADGAQSQFELQASNNNCRFYLLRLPVNQSITRQRHILTHLRNVIFENIMENRANALVKNATVKQNASFTIMFLIILLIF